MGQLTWLLRWVLIGERGTIWVHKPTRLKNGDVVKEAWVIERLNHDTRQVEYTLATPEQENDAMWMSAIR